MDPQVFIPGILIVAQGFIEWQEGREIKKVKNPVFLTLPGKQPMGFAGLWEKWSPTTPGQPLYRSCAIVTVRASERVRPYHHRMPAVLQPDLYPQWLDPRFRDTTTLSRMLNSGVHTEFDVSDPPADALTGNGLSDQ